MSYCHSVIASYWKEIICILKENGHRPKWLHPCMVHTIVSMLYYTKCCYNRLPTSNHWDHTHAAATRTHCSSVDTPLNLNLNLIHSSLSSLCEESSPTNSSRSLGHAPMLKAHSEEFLTVQETLEHLKGFPRRALTATFEKSFRSFIKKHKCSNWFYNLYSSPFLAHWKCLWCGHAASRCSIPTNRTTPDKSVVDKTRNL